MLTVRDFTEDDRATYIAMSIDFYSGDSAIAPVREENFSKTFDAVLQGDKSVRGCIIEKNGERAGYDGMKSVLAECTGAGVIMLKDGKIPDIAYHMRDPRTAIGYAPDGTLWLLTADGRGFSGASGLTYAEMGDMFMALGCEAAANLDGGGSAQMLVKEPGTASHIIVNSPADGKERPVINAWAVIKSK